MEEKNSGMSVSFKKGIFRLMEKASYATGATYDQTIEIKTRAEETDQEDDMKSIMDAEITIE